MNNSPTIRVLPTPAEVAATAAELVAQSARECFAARADERDFVLALSGGSTPQLLFKYLADHPELLDWQRVHVLFVDERCVPPAHADSNFGAATRLLLDHVPCPFEQIHRLAGEKDPQQAASEYDRLLAERFDHGPDLVLLGMGSDGHTASLFPGTEALLEEERRCVANFIPKLGAWRLTMSFPYLNRARRIAVLVTGQEKSRVVTAALEGRAAPGEYPIQAIAPLSGELTWLLDAAAAGMFDEDE